MRHRITLIFGVFVFSVLCTVMWYLYQQRATHDRSAFLSPAEARERLNRLSNEVNRGDDNEYARVADLVTRLSEAVRGADEAYRADADSDERDALRDAIDNAQFRGRTPQQREAAQALLRKLETDGLLAELRELGGMPTIRVEWTESGSVYDEFSNRLARTGGPARTVSKLLVLAGQSAAQTRDFDAWLQYFRSSIALARMQAAGLLQIDALLGIHTFSMSLLELRYEIFEYEFPSPVLTEVQRYLESMPELLDLDTVLKAEAIFATTNPAVPDDELSDVIGERTAAEYVDAVNAIMDRARDELNKPAQLRRRFGEVSREYVNALSGAGAFDPVEFMAASIPRTLARQLALHTEINGTRLLLAIERYRIDHDRPPDALAELVPDYVNALPADPLSGQPFHYRRELDGDTPPHYVLYSVGIDLDDDGGRDDGWESITPMLLEDGDGDFVLTIRRLPPTSKGTAPDNLLDVSVEDNGN